MTVEEFSLNHVHADLVLGMYQLIILDSGCLMCYLTLHTDEAHNFKHWPRNTSEPDLQTS